MTRKQVQRRRRLVKRKHIKNKVTPEIWPPTDARLAEMATNLLGQMVHKDTIRKDRMIQGFRHYITDDYEVRVRA